MKHVLKLAVFVAALYFAGSVPTKALAFGSQPILNLEAHFHANGISYIGPLSHTGNTSSSSDNVFIPYPDPADHETVGVFFEIETRAALTDNVHFAVGLRGPRNTGNPDDFHRGRGVAFGVLALHPGCTNRGWFIENFSAQDAVLHPTFNGKDYANPLSFEYGIMDQNTVWMHQHTECIPGPGNGPADWATYRVDVHVSKNNVYVIAWVKSVVPPYGTYYLQVAELNCSVTPALIGGQTIYGPAPCPEASGQTLQLALGGQTYSLMLPNDRTTPPGVQSGVFLGSSSPGKSPGQSWKMNKIYIATWN